MVYFAIKIFFALIIVGIIMTLIELFFNFSFWEFFFSSEKEKKARKEKENHWDNY